LRRKKNRYKNKGPKFLEKLEESKKQIAMFFKQESKRKHGKKFKQ
jgi:hypothetical protein